MTLRPDKINDSPAFYGRKGQAWSAAFVDYMKFIVLHPNYAGMPDAVNDAGNVQWEAPSNRRAGQYKDTHHRRRDWWRAKALGIGIDVRGANWISRTAKAIHPTGQKPCKRCGQVLRLAYAYPSSNFVNRCRREFGDRNEPDPFETIVEYVQRLFDTIGEGAMRALPRLLRTNSVTPPDLKGQLGHWLEWLEDVYIPSEPSLLSPGAMSNAPDRFDGFHSFNRCCRGEADTGRHEVNMRGYSTDRRVFEYWSEGNWVAADRMMGLVRARYRDHPSADGGAGPPSADHIGPLSLGFTHRPEFRLLSRSANSAKNNRMTYWDADYLRRHEGSDTAVASWYAHPIWKALRSRVVDDETALRLSKIMRDNQRQAMMFLAELLERGYATFLASLLELEYADFEVSFEEVVIDDFVTKFGALVSEPRSTKYASEQKARRLRVGFAALRSYSAKSNRHFLPLKSKTAESALQLAKAALAGAEGQVHSLDRDILRLLELPSAKIYEDEFRALTGRLPRTSDVGAFVQAKMHLEDAMGAVAEELAARWEDERYVRAQFSLDED